MEGKDGGGTHWSIDVSDDNMQLLLGTASMYAQTRLMALNTSSNPGPHAVEAWTVRRQASGVGEDIVTLVMRLEDEINMRRQGSI